MINLAALFCTFSIISMSPLARRCWLSHSSLYELANHRSDWKWLQPGWWHSCSLCLSCSFSLRRRMAVDDRYLAAGLAVILPSGSAKPTSCSWLATYSSYRLLSCRSAISTSLEWSGHEPATQLQALRLPPDHACISSLHAVPGDCNNPLPPAHWY